MSEPLTEQERAALTDPDEWPACLTERELAILVWRYGLDDGGWPRTLDEIGRMCGLTGSRVGQIEKQANAKLREALAESS